MAPRRKTILKNILIISTLLVGIYTVLWICQTPSNDLLKHDLLGKGDHPIDNLVREAQHEQREYRPPHANKPPTLTQAVRNYRAKRSRHPPPGFDVWYNFAVQREALIDEFFFDQIYEDLEPFWGVTPLTLRVFAVGWPQVLTIRNNTVQKRSWNDQPTRTGIWKEMVDGLPFLPDVDLPVSPSEEPRVVVPYEKIVKYMQEAQRQRDLHNALSIQEIRDEFVPCPKIMWDAPPEPSWASVEGLQQITPATYWVNIVRTCRPGDPVFSQSNPYIGIYSPPTFSSNYTAGTTQGFVSNFTTSKSLCHNPNLRTLHGHLIGPGLDFIYTDLKPVFSAAKLQGVNNDILFPNPVHWLDWGHYVVQKSYLPWNQRKNMAVWRGTATGGRHTASTWWGFQRLRFAHLTNSTVVSYVEKHLNQVKLAINQGLPLPARSAVEWNVQNFPFPSHALFRLAAQSYGKLGQWTASIADVGLTHLACAPFYAFGPADKCSYLDQHYRVMTKLTSQEIDGYKYLPDIDGEASSGRYRSFLHSFGVPIKASLFVEWADARLRPWLHFVPMSNEFQDLFGILQYFMGYKATAVGEVSVPDHDVVGQWIGQQGAEWSSKVLRRSDMQVYMYRLILEYARICADDRIHLGYVADLYE